MGGLQPCGCEHVVPPMSSLSLLPYRAQTMGYIYLIVGVLAWKRD